VTEKTNKTIETKETTEESPLVLTKNQHATLSLILKKLGPESIFNLDLLGFHLNRIMGPITLSTTVKALVKLGVLVQVEVGSNEFAFVLNPNLNPDIKFSLKVNSSKASESNKTHPASPTPKDNDEHGDKAACEGMDQVIFFPEKGASTKEAKKICQGCNIRIKCLDYAIENNINNGFWGGMSERERRRLRIKRAQET